MSFLDIMLSVVVVCLVFSARPIGKEEQVFGRDTTATLRGVAMLGIILHHIHNRFGYGSPILSQTGYLAVGLFFFISGYGNMLSINKKNSVKFDWIISKVLKIYIPFFVGYLVYYLELLFIYSDLRPSWKETIIDIFSVSLPNQVSWFPKIILLCFAIHWLAKNIFNNILLQNTFITSCIFVYIIAMWKIGMAMYWYNSVACYAVGCFIANPVLLKKSFEYFRNNRIFAFIMSLCLFGASFIVSMKIGYIRMICPIFISLVCYYFSHLFKSETKILSWIGKNSFEFYVFQSVSLQLFAFTIEINKFLYAFLVLLSSFGFVYLYLRAKKIIIAKKTEISTT